MVQQKIVVDWNVSCAIIQLVILVQRKYFKWWIEELTKFFLNKHDRNLDIVIIRQIKFLTMRTIFYVQDCNLAQGFKQLIAVRQKVLLT